MQPPTSRQNQPSSASDEKITAWIHWALTTLVAVVFAVVVSMLWTSASVPDNPEWPYALLLSLATASTIVALLRRLPLQNVLWAALIIAVIGGAAQSLGEITDMPFGPFMFGPEAGPKLFKTLPWAVPLLWVFAILNSRGVARLIMRPWRKTKSYGFWVIGITAALVMLFDLAFDPFASRLHRYWFWTPTKFPVTWQGAPLVNFLGWAAVSLLILAFVTPMLINKRPKGKSSPDYHPLGIWLGAVLLFGLAAALKGLWPATTVDAGIGVVTAVFAIRGARW
ncbi:MAG: carotenoid biosynthesis protein [Verrucomicrobiia bacterium]